MNKNIAPMGWNSWDCYGASVTEETVKANARFMAEKLKVLETENKQIRKEIEKKIKLLTKVKETQGLIEEE